MGKSYQNFSILSLKETGEVESSNHSVGVYKGLTVSVYSVHAHSVGVYKGLTVYVYSVHTHTRWVCTKDWPCPSTVCTHTLGGYVQRTDRVRLQCGQNWTHTDSSRPHRSYQCLLLFCLFIVIVCVCFYTCLFVDYFVCMSVCLFRTLIRCTKMAEHTSDFFKTLLKVML